MPLKHLFTLLLFAGAFSVAEAETVTESILNTVDSEEGSWPCLFYELNYNSDIAVAERAKWYSPDEDESYWREGLGPFSIDGNKFLVTQWQSTVHPILIRRHFTLSEEDMAKISAGTVSLTYSYDENPKIWLNGTQIVSATGWNDNYLNGANSTGEANMSEFISAVSSHNVHFLSGHTHNIFNRRHTEKFAEHNSGAVCASWWWSGHLTEGFHLSQDGAPGGYGIWKFNGAEFTQTFKAAGHDANYQFRAYDMNKVKEVLTASLGGSHKAWLPYVNAVQSFPANAILVNVWDYDSDWKVSISENGTELNVVPVAAYDPLHMYALTAARCKTAGANSTPGFLTSSWNHFFQATASSASSTVTVRVTDRNGSVFTETLKRPKAFTPSEYKNQ